MTLGETEPGDVFYLAGNPAVVWQHVTPCEDYKFMVIGNECDFRVQSVGTGDPGQQVTVVHNTLRHLTETVADDRARMLGSHLLHGT